MSPSASFPKETLSLFFRDAAKVFEILAIYPSSIDSLDGGGMGIEGIFLKGKLKQGDGGCDQLAADLNITSENVLVTNDDVNARLASGSYIIGIMYSAFGGYERILHIH